MLVIIGLNIRIADRRLHRRGIQLDIAYAELFRRHKADFILIVVAGHFLIGHLLLRRQRVDINNGFTHHALLRD